MGWGEEVEEEAEREKGMTDEDEEEGPATTEWEMNQCGFEARWVL